MRYKCVGCGFGCMSLKLMAQHVCKDKEVNDMEVIRDHRVNFAEEKKK